VLPANGKWQAISAEEMRALHSQANWQADRRGAAVVRSGDDWWEYLQSHNRHRGNGKPR